MVAADLNYLGSLSFGVTGDAQRTVFLRQSTPITVGWVNPVNWTNRPSWHIGLSQRVPLELRVQSGIGDADINLTNLRLESVRLEGNIGQMNVTLAAGTAAYPVMIRGGAGGIAINIPSGANADVIVRGGMGGLAVNIADDAAAKINLAGGVGHTVMQPGFSKMEAAAPMLTNTGVWETANFNDARRRVTIDVAEGMVGNMRVRVLGA